MIRRLRIESLQRGSATAEVAILVPLLVLLIALIVQFTEYAHVNQVCESASAYGERFAELYQGNQSQAQQAVATFLRTQGINPKSYQISVSISPYSVIINVRTKVPSFIPFLKLVVSSSAVGNQQRFRPEE